MPKNMVRLINVQNAVGQNRFNTDDLEETHLEK